MYKEIRKKVFVLVQDSTERYSSSWFFDLFLIVLISLNVLGLILMTVPELKVVIGPYFTYFEGFSFFSFGIEYLFRVWSCVEIKKYRHPVFGRLKYMFTTMAIIDLLSVFSFYFISGHSLTYIRFLRLLRIVMIFKFLRYLKSLRLIVHVLKEKRAELIIVISFIFLLLTFSSSLMYFVEHPVQPLVFRSIPDAMWWGINTLTTVGANEGNPITLPGKILAGIVSILGIGLFALPTGILASAFSEHVTKHKQKKPAKKCPHCGENIE